MWKVDSTKKSRMKISGEKKNIVSWTDNSVIVNAKEIFYAFSSL